MSDGIDLTEMDIWAKQIVKMENIPTKVIDEALMAAVDIGMASAKRKCPVYSGPDQGRMIYRNNKSGSRVESHRLTPGFLKDNIKVGDIRENERGRSIVFGPGKGDISASYYGKFIEYGTSHQPAYPFLRPAYRETKSLVKAAMVGIITGSITKEFKKG